MGWSKLPLLHSLGSNILPHVTVFVLMGSTDVIGVLWLCFPQEQEDAWQTESHRETHSVDNRGKPVTVFDREDRTS